MKQKAERVETLMVNNTFRNPQDRFHRRRAWGIGMVCAGLFCLPMSVEARELVADSTYVLLETPWVAPPLPPVKTEPSFDQEHAVGSPVSKNLISAHTSEAPSGGTQSGALYPENVSHSEEATALEPKVILEDSAEPAPVDVQKDVSLENDFLSPEEPSAQDLDQVLQSNQAKKKFTSTEYYIQVVGVLLMLLGGFYLVARLVLPKLTGTTANQPLIPFSKTPESKTAMPSHTPEARPSLLSLLFSPPSRAKELGLTPQIISRTRVGQNREIQVVQIADRILVVGSTPQQLNLLTEFEVPKANPRPGQSASPETSVHHKYLQDNDVYKKYLPSQGTESVSGGLSRPLSDDEQIVVLSDYDDHYEPS